VSEGTERLLLDALEEVLGAGVVLDGALRVVAWTQPATVLVDGIQAGIAVPKLLCGQSEERPLAEALAEGRAVVAQVPRPSPRGLRMIEVRASPIRRDEELRGWLLTLEGEPWESGSPDAPVAFHEMHSRAPSMKALFRQIQRVARRDVTVLIRGETGTGKELVARAIHAASPRANGPFRAINCAALPPNLLESELFGHVRGAFTGAVRDYPGHLRLAEGGTLFLDEVAELSLELQAKLLRVLQERTVIPVGGRQPIGVDVRVVSATHTALREAVAAGTFREDLLYRLRVIPLYLPPLRERPGDVLMLARRFLRELSDEHRTVTGISAGARRALETYGWPGNVRELQNAMEYAIVMGDGPILQEADLPPEVRGEEPSAPRTNVPAVEASGEEERILRALERAGGHRGRAAAILGMSRSTLWRRMRDLGLLDDD